MASHGPAAASTALARQMAQLRVEAGRSGTAGARASLLFGPKEAEGYDVHAIFNIGVNGFTELVGLEPRLADFERDLFSEAWQEVDRDLRDAEFNATLNTRIAAFLRLAAPHLLTRAATKALEYLIRRFRVHVYNVDALMAAALPYHDHALFGRLVHVLDLTVASRVQGPGSATVPIWAAFLTTAGDKSAPVPRATLVAQGRRDTALVRFIADAAAPPAADAGIDLPPPPTVAIVFYSLFMCDWLAAHATLPDSHVSLMAPYLTRGLKATDMPQYQDATYLILAKLAQRVVLERAPLDAMITLLCLNIPAHRPQHALTALASLITSQSGEAAGTAGSGMGSGRRLAGYQLSSRSLAALLSCSISSLTTHIATLTTQFNIQPFLRILLASLVTHMATGTASTAAAGLVRDLVGTLSTDALATVVPIITRHIVLTYRDVVAGAGGPTAAIQPVSDALASLLHALSQRYQPAVDAGLQATLAAIQSRPAAVAAPATAPTNGKDGTADVARTGGSAHGGGGGGRPRSSSLTNASDVAAALDGALQATLALPALSATALSGGGVEVDTHVLHWVSAAVDGMMVAGGGEGEGESTSAGHTASTHTPLSLALSHASSVVRQRGVAMLHTLAQRVVSEGGEAGDEGRAHRLRMIAACLDRALADDDVTVVRGALKTLHICLAAGIIPATTPAIHQAGGEGEEAVGRAQTVRDQLSYVLQRWAPDAVRPLVTPAPASSSASTTGARGKGSKAPSVNVSIVHLDEDGGSGVAGGGGGGDWPPLPASGLASEAMMRNHVTLAARHVVAGALAIWVAHLAPLWASSQQADGVHPTLASMQHELTVALLNHLPLGGEAVDEGTTVPPADVAALLAAPMDAPIDLRRVAVSLIPAAAASGLALFQRVPARTPLTHHLAAALVADMDAMSSPSPSSSLPAVFSPVLQVVELLAYRPVAGGANTGPDASTSPLHALLAPLTGTNPRYGVVSARVVREASSRACWHAMAILDCALEEVMQAVEGDPAHHVYQLHALQVATVPVLRDWWRGAREFAAACIVAQTTTLSGGHKGSDVGDKEAESMPVPTGAAAALPIPPGGQGAAALAGVTAALDAIPPASMVGGGSQLHAGSPDVRRMHAHTSFVLSVYGRAMAAAAALLRHLPHAAMGEAGAQVALQSLLAPTAMTTVTMLGVAPDDVGSSSTVDTMEEFQLDASPSPTGDGEVGGLPSPLTPEHGPWQASLHTLLRCAVLLLSTPEEGVRFADCQLHIAALFRGLVVLSPDLPAHLPAALVAAGPPLSPILHLRAAALMHLYLESPAVARPPAPAWAAFAGIAIPRLLVAACSADVTARAASPSSSVALPISICSQVHPTHFRRAVLALLAQAAAMGGTSFWDTVAHAFLASPVVQMGASGDGHGCDDAACRGALRTALQPHLFTTDLASVVRVITSTFASEPSVAAFFATAIVMAGRAAVEVGGVGAWMTWSTLWTALLPVIDAFAGFVELEGSRMAAATTGPASVAGVAVHEGQYAAFVAAVMVLRPLAAAASAPSPVLSRLVPVMQRLLRLPVSVTMLRHGTPRGTPDRPTAGTPASVLDVIMDRVDGHLHRACQLVTGSGGAAAGRTGADDLLAALFECVSRGPAVAASAARHALSRLPVTAAALLRYVRATGLAFDVPVNSAALGGGAEAGQAGKRGKGGSSTGGAVASSAVSSDVVLPSLVVSAASSVYANRPATMKWLTAATVFGEVLLSALQAQKQRGADAVARASVGGTAVRPAIVGLTGETPRRSTLVVEGGPSTVRFATTADSVPASPVAGGSGGGGGSAITVYAHVDDLVAPLFSMLHMSIALPPHLPSPRAPVAQGRRSPGAAVGAGHGGGGGEWDVEDVVSSLEYLQRIVADCLLHIARALPVASQGERIPASTASMDPGVVIHIIRTTTSTQTRSVALLLLGALATHAPQRVLTCIIPVFHTVTANTLTREDSYALLVLHRLIEAVVPPLLTHGPSVGVTVHSLLQVFAHRLPLIPPHRHRGVYTALITTVSNPGGVVPSGASSPLGTSRFAHAMIALLMHAAIVTAPTSASMDAPVTAADAMAALCSSLLSPFSPSQQVHACGALVHCARRLLSLAAVEGGVAVGGDDDGGSDDDEVEGEEEGDAMDGQAARQGEEVDDVVACRRVLAADMPPLLAALSVVGGDGEGAARRLSVGQLSSLARQLVAFVESHLGHRSFMAAAVALQEVQFDAAVQAEGGGKDGGATSVTMRAIGLQRDYLSFAEQLFALAQHVSAAAAGAAQQVTTVSAQVEAGKAQAMKGVAAVGSEPPAGGPTVGTKRGRVHAPPPPAHTSAAVTAATPSVVAAVAPLVRRLDALTTVSTFYSKLEDGVFRVFHKLAALLTPATLLTVMTELLTHEVGAIRRRSLAFLAEHLQSNYHAAHMADPSQPTSTAVSITTLMDGGEMSLYLALVDTLREVVAGGGEEEDGSEAGGGVDDDVDARAVALQALQVLCAYFGRDAVDPFTAVLQTALGELGGPRAATSPILLSHLTLTAGTVMLHVGTRALPMLPPLMTHILSMLARLTPVHGVSQQEVGGSTLLANHATVQSLRSAVLTAATMVLKALPAFASPYLLPLLQACLHPCFAAAHSVLAASWEAEVAYMAAPTTRPVLRHLPPAFVLDTRLALDMDAAAGSVTGEALTSAAAGRYTPFAPLAAAVAPPSAGVAGGTPAKLAVPPHVPGWSSGGGTADGAGDGAGGEEGVGTGTSLPATAHKAATAVASAALTLTRLIIAKQPSAAVVPAVLQAVEWAPRAGGPLALAHGLRALHAVVTPLPRKAVRAHWPRIMAVMMAALDYRWRCAHPAAIVTVMAHNPDGATSDVTPAVAAAVNTAAVDASVVESESLTVWAALSLKLSEGEMKPTLARWVQWAVAGPDEVLAAVHLADDAGIVSYSPATVGGLTSGGGGDAGAGGKGKRHGKHSDGSAAGMHVNPANPPRPYMQYAMLARKLTWSRLVAALTSLLKSVFLPFFTNLLPPLARELSMPLLAPMASAAGDGAGRGDTDGSGEDEEGAEGEASSALPPTLHQLDLLWPVTTFHAPGGGAPATVQPTSPHALRCALLACLCTAFACDDAPDPHGFFSASKHGQQRLEVALKPLVAQYQVSLLTAPDAGAAGGGATATIATSAAPASKRRAPPSTDGHGVGAGAMEPYRPGIPGGKAGYAMYTRTYLHPAIAAAVTATRRDTLWKPINNSVLMLTRDGRARVRLAGIQAAATIVRAGGDETLVLLPETLQYLAETQHDDDTDVRAATHALLAMLEKQSGEDLQAYLA